MFAGVSLEHNNSAIPNFGLLAHTDIDTNDVLGVLGSNLVCRTDNTTCCRGPGVDVMSQGDWYNPTGDRVTFPGEGNLPIGQIYRVRTGPQVVRIRRQRASAATANGIYRCEVADQNGVVQTRYVGLYTEGDGELG